MTGARLSIVLAVLLLAACTKTSPPPAASEPCGFRTDDWCAAPADDPCGTHRTPAACKADTRCEGMAYRGESAVACIADARCFASNCPTVGCISRCEALDEAACAAQSSRCKVLAEHGCARKSPCAATGAPALNP